MFFSLPIFCLRIPAPPLLPSFSTLHRTQDGPVHLYSRSVLVYNLLAWPGEGHHRTHGITISPLSPSACRAPSFPLRPLRLPSRALGFPGTRSLPLSFSPSRLCLPFGNADPFLTRPFPELTSSVDSPPAIHLKECVGCVLRQEYKRREEWRRRCTMHHMLVGSEVYVR